ncbi:MAG TPA: hypothetical protein VK672_01690 [Solirubrobacteraceae bacterium]|nr:hypothetical protein [Solirubrobacteraceae bacterium]
MSTRQESFQRPWERPARPIGVSRRLGPFDPFEAVALVARSQRELLLAAHRHRLGLEDLEDCYSQATLEMLIRARRGGAFAGRAHVANALEQRFLSRIQDRRRAIGGRSPMEAAMASALPLVGREGNAMDILDTRAGVERLALLRHDLRIIGQVARGLSFDQRLVLANQLSCAMDCREFCDKHGWSTEKYRKVAQRARARLARLLAGHAEGGAGGHSPAFCPASAESSD